MKEGSDLLAYSVLSFLESEGFTEIECITETVYSPYVDLKFYIDRSNRTYYRDPQVELYYTSVFEGKIRMESYTLRIPLLVHDEGRFIKDLIKRFKTNIYLRDDYDDK